MGPRRLLLAPLALLLLALCGLSSQSKPMIVSTNGIATTSLTKLDGGIPASVTATNKDKLKSEGFAKGWFSLALASQLMDMSDEDLGAQKAVLDNGVLCALDRANAAKEMNTLISGADPIPAAKQPENAAFAAALGIAACGSSTDAEVKCVCDAPYKPALYCVGVMWKNKRSPAPKSKCPADVMGPFKAELPVLSIAYDYEKASKQSPQLESAMQKLKAGDFAALQALYPQFAAFFCEAIGGKAEAHLEALFKTDWVYASLEVLSLIGLTGDKDAADKLTEGCASATPEELAYPFIECLCSDKYGFNFCIYKAVGKALEKEKYLDCTKSPPELVDDKKPASIKILPDKKGGGGTGNVTTASPPSAGDVANLLPVVLTAAAAALRH